MFYKAKKQIMQDYNYPKGFSTITNYFAERWANFNKNFEITSFLSNFIGTVILGLLTGPGKFSVMSPLFTGWYPTIMGAISVIFSVAFQMAINRFYAHGNLVLIILEIFNI
jgi:fluoride ion exporter CrcB/FEX